MPTVCGRERPGDDGCHRRRPAARRRRAASAGPNASRDGSDSVEPGDDAQAARGSSTTPKPNGTGPAYPGGAAVTAVQRPQRAVGRQRDRLDVGRAACRGRCRGAESGGDHWWASSRRRARSFRRRGARADPRRSRALVPTLRSRPSSRAGRARRRRGRAASWSTSRGVLTEPRRARGRDLRFADDAAGMAPAGGSGRSPDRRPSRGRPRVDHVRVGEDVGRGVRGRDRDVARDAALLDLARQSSVAVHSATMPLITSPWAARSASLVKRGSSSRSGRSIALHRRGKLASDPATMHTYLPSRGRVVVERRRVGEAVALALAHDAEPVVAGERPLEDAQRRAVQRGVDHGAFAAAARRARTARATAACAANTPVR